MISNTAAQSHTSIKRLAHEHPDWLDVVLVCYQIAGDTNNRFAGAWVVWRLGRWVPSLRTLVRYSIFEKLDTSRRGRRAYYRMIDRERVGNKLQELGIVQG